MSDKPFDICERTFQFSVRIVNLCSFLSETPGPARELSKQLIRSGTSIGANVEESRSAQSTADFIHKLEIALKEDRETRYWIRLIFAANIVPENRLQPLLNEINELMNIIAAMIVKSKENKKK
ncbi:four helix bundle protein [Argonema galeatum]|uniref:four helix bundle protein n=1 Tax=Argonema galeatum TaxID=2942762 RepID=UPI00201204F7|nr:four helix bundle protein [Argonema galeatum]MCL1469038.1 four helix bundle protein [Argonema galeatum A003/A1]